MTTVTQTRQKRRRLTAAERAEVNAESLARAQANTSLTNYPTIYAEFAERGIALDDIIPRVNVLTYRAWLAKGRQVRKGEKSVKVVTWITSSKIEYDKSGKEKAPRRFPRSAAVFHISQTEPIEQDKPIIVAPSVEFFSKAD